jgi:negative regulator of sigma E activity
MTARRWWLAGISAAVVIAAIVVVVFVWVLPNRSDSDCTTVRQLIQFNQAHNQKLTAQSDPNDPTETSLSDYESWAAQMRDFATEITDPQLAPHAQQVAELANQTVTVVREARDDSNQSPVSGPPPWVQKYAQMNIEFRKELNDLETACPA